MKILKISSAILAVASVIGFGASTALAGECVQDLRNANGTTGGVGGQDTLTASCTRLFAATASGVGSIQQPSAGTFSVNTNKTAGPAGASVRSQCCSSTGAILAQSQDATVGGGSNNVNCPAGTTHWRVRIVYTE
ncbi:MAG: hypothetical protein ABW217_20615 [Polyangiaceae bacterium]